MLYRLGVFVLFCMLLPAQLVVGFFVLVTSGWPVFFLQRRTGLNGKPFLIYKFRSMPVGAELLQAKFQKENQADGPVFKIADDPRFTRLGKFLAHTGLDELPQLYNVLRGDMALFGPRPLPVAEAAKLAPWMRARHTIKPGILSPAILTGKYHENFDAWMKSDVAYTGKKSIWYDIQLSVRAVRFVSALFVRALLHL